MRSLGRPIVLFALIAAARAAEAQVPANITAPLGSNVHIYSNWASEWSMANALKMGRPWLTQCSPGVQPDCQGSIVYDTGEEALLDLDADGYPRTLPAPTDAPIFWFVGTTLFSMTGHYPAGRYVVLYDGEGTLGYSGSATKNVALSTPGRDIVDVDPSIGAIQFRISSTDPRRVGSYIHNIRFLLPGQEATYPTELFHPLFLSRMQLYKTLRFMQWQEIQGSTLAHWIDRPLPTSYTYINPGRGVPVEIMVALANRTHADAWLSVPHQADDEYVASFAALVRDQLGADQKVYIEYSNEVWNDAADYTQSVWVEQQATQRWNTADAPWVKRMNWYGMRSAQICDIWKSVFGNQAGRVKCVVATQSAGTWTALSALDCPLWTEGAPCYAHGIDVLAIAPYISFHNLDDDAVRTQLLGWAALPDHGLENAMYEVQHGGRIIGSYPGGALQDTLDQMAANRQIAAARGLELAAYEAGTNLYDPRQDAMINQIFFAVNRDPRIGQVYDAYFAGWRAAGGTIMNHYVTVQAYDNQGSCGALEYMDQTSTPKWDAILRFLTGNYCWWGCACGNGRIDPGEQCDDSNVRSGDCCSSACQLEPATTICRGAAGACDAVERCSGTAPTCPGDAKLTAPCRPVANACDVAAEVCPGNADDCPADGAARDCSYLTSACTAGFCDPTIGCTTRAINQGGACDDGDPATTEDVCILGICRQPNAVPALASLTPASVAAGSATFTLTADGTAFETGAYLTLAGTPLTTVSASATRITATVPAALVALYGNYPVAAVNVAPGGGSSAPLTLAVNNPMPEVLSINPNHLVAGSPAMLLTIAGRALVPSSQVTFAGTPLAVTYVSATLINATVPAALITTAGTYGLVVTNPAPGGGSAASVTVTVLTPAPTLTALTPSSAMRGAATLTVTVDGAPFLRGAMVVFDGAYQNATYQSGTRLTTSIPASAMATAGRHNVQVANPAPSAGPGSILVFTVNNPVPAISGITPTGVLAGSGGGTLTVDGNNFVNGSHVTFGGANLATTFVSATRLTAAIPTASLALAGLVTVTVVNDAPGGGASAGRTFSINNPVPVLAAATPAAVTQGNPGFTLTLDGSAFVQGSRVTFGGASVTATYVSPTRLTAAIPAASISADGAHAVQVTNTTPGGGTTTSVDVTVNHPLLFSVRRSTRFGAVIAAKDDLVRYDTTSGQFSLAFDGAVRGLPVGANITAVHRSTDGSWVLGFDRSVRIRSMAGRTVAGPSDLVRYDPTARAWSFYFDGSRVGLSTNSEAIDALHILADGRLLVSTVGSFAVPGPNHSVLRGRGSDILAFTPTTLGPSTSGTWALYLDSHDVGLDTDPWLGLDGIGMLSDGSLLLSVLGSGTIPGLGAVTGDDVIRFLPTSLGTTTAGTFSMWLRASTAGISGGVDAIY